MEEIKKILLTPIIILAGNRGIKTKKTIYLRNDYIYTTCSLAKDCDISDVSLLFYRLLYDFDDNWMPSQMFTGDTINSYRTVVRFASNEKRMFWASKYHCLANFWVLPHEIGRKVSELSKSSAGRQSATIKSFNEGKRDYIDRFLHQYIECNNSYIGRYKDYTDKFALGDFATKHFLQNIYLGDKNKVIDFSLIKKTDNNELSQGVDNIINTMWEKTQQRAEIISKSGKCDKLLDYFQNFEDS